jgi:hypothetical protein
LRNEKEYEQPEQRDSSASSCAPGSGQVFLIGSRHDVSGRVLWTGRRIFLCGRRASRPSIQFRLCCDVYRIDARSLLADEKRSCMGPIIDSID